ncbi:uncharacterized protein N7529_006568 [Penicillium soppii]|uniref:uncharacterized protein n=1 Tax=Penicillium soppii TaxID=69789 RepID=UPI002547E0E5|nr:uncharacterized protein N7529_006568 [Penicillium soppii]KAJ5864652.1 hypothetical protein N7529_006568 [Penicillium soppii]
MHPTYILSVLALVLPVYSSSSTARMGCYSDVGNMKNQGPYTYQSPGYCRNKCSAQGHTVAALSRGNMCYCGDKLPSESAKIDDDKCDTVCLGYPAETCGGQDTFNVIQATENVGASDSGSDSDNASTTAAPTAATAAGGIIVAPSTTGVQTGIVTAASAINSKSASVASSKTAGSASAAVTSSATPTPTSNAAGTFRAGSSLIGAAVAGMGLLL